MKPSIHNYALAHTCGFSGAAGIVCALGWLLWALHSEGTLTGGRVAVVWIVIAAIPAAALGWLVVGILFLGPFLFQIASRIQGAPFRAGDPVWILAGKHKGTLTHVYEAWKERGQVRVDLGPDAKKKVEDVFCLVAVCRAKGEKGPKRLSEDKKGLRPPMILHRLWRSDDETSLFLDDDRDVCRWHPGMLVSGTDVAAAFDPPAVEDAQRRDADPGVSQLLLLRPGRWTDALRSDILMLSRVQSQRGDPGPHFSAAQYPLIWCATASQEAVPAATPRRCLPCGKQ